VIFNFAPRSIRVGISFQPDPWSFYAGKFPVYLLLNSCLASRHFDYYWYPIFFPYRPSPKAQTFFFCLGTLPINMLHSLTKVALQLLSTHLTIIASTRDLSFPHSICLDFHYIYFFFLHPFRRSTSSLLIWIDDLSRPNSQYLDHDPPIFHVLWIIFYFRRHWCALFLAFLVALLIDLAVLI